jgi:hypothetical protein
MPAFQSLSPATQSARLFSTPDLTETPSNIFLRQANPSFYALPTSTQAERPRSPPQTRALDLQKQPEESISFSGSEPSTDSLWWPALRQSPGEHLLSDQSRECHYAAKIILDQIQNGLSGCTEAEHQFQDMRHYTDAPDNHYPLDATYTGINAFPPSVGLSSNAFRSNQGAPRSLAPPAPLLDKLFTGTDARLSKPQNICLHLEHVNSTSPYTSSDVDSSIAFPTSLAVIRGEFYYCPTLQFQRKIQTDLHLERTIFYPSSTGPDRQATLQLREIPHLYVEAVLGIYNYALYIFFL